MNTNHTGTSEVKVTENMVDTMRSTRPWTIFLSVLGFIGVALFVIVGTVMIFLRTISVQDPKMPNTFMGVMYIIFAVVYGFPSLYLYRYSYFIKLFLQNRRENDLESALSYQKSFWQFVGILTIITIVISILGIIAAIVIPLLVRHRL